MNKFEEDLNTFIEIMSDGFTKELVEKNGDMVLKIKHIYDTDPKAFFGKINSAQFKLNQIIKLVVKIPNQKNMYILEHITSGLYEHFYRQLMEKIEGSSCCGDKSRFIARRSLRSLQEKNNLSLYDDYMECDQIKENKEERAYWSPRTIKDTDEAMGLFWDWYLLRK